MKKESEKKSDGRTIIFYSFVQTAIERHSAENDDALKSQSSSGDKRSTEGASATEQEKGDR